MPWDQSDYEEAKGILAEGKEDPALLKGLTAKVSQYEDDRARGNVPAPAAAGRTPQPAISVSDQTIPKAGPGGFWKPNRPLDTRDYIPQDAGGKLAIWRDMPLEVYQRKVALPQRQMAIASGQQAMMQLQRMGAGAFSPEDQMKLTLLIAQGKAAEAQDPNQLTDKDPAYQAFNEGEFQKAVQQRAQDPEAGPIQRLEKMDTSSIIGKLGYGAEKGKGLALAAGRGAVDMGTLGLGTGAIDATTEALGDRGAMETGRQIQEAHPWASGLGGAAMALLRPGNAGATLMRGVYGKALPAVGRYGAAALSGAAGNVVEGLGKDLSAEGADALSSAPEAALDRGRIDPSRLGLSTLVRAGGGAVGGVAGQAGSDLFKGMSNKISELAIKGTGGRTPYEAAERAGYKFDPVRGVVAPEGVKAQAAITRETGTPWAERFADKTAPEVVQNVDRFAVGEKAAMGKENLSYFNSVGDQYTPLSNVQKAATDISGELRGVNPGLALEVRKLVHGMDPMMTPRQMGDAVTMLSGQADAASAGSNELKAQAMKRLQAALMEDMQSLPKGNLPEGWPALREQHEARGASLEEARQLTGVRNPGAQLPDEIASLNKNLMDQGKRGFPVEKEAALDRFMPPDLKREALMLRAANMMDDLTGSRQGAGPYPSRAGLINYAEGKIVPRLYGLGRAVSKQVPDNYPVTDQMFSWVNSRMPRAALFTPGMNLPQLVQQQMEMQGRPKKWADLTPEQQQLLLGALGSPEQQQTLQPGASP